MEKAEKRDDIETETKDNRGQQQIIRNKTKY